MKSVRFGDVSIQIKAIGFDKDGTLFDSIAFWSYIDRLRREEFTAVVGEEYSYEWYRMMGWHEFPYRIDYSGILSTATTPEEILLTAGLIYQFKRWPWSECKQAAEQIFERADQRMVIKEAFHKKSGVPDIFFKLREYGLYTGILTSDAWNRTLKCVQLLGLDDLLDFIITPEKVKRGKPAPDMAEKCCEMMNIKPEHLAVVGDSIVDIEMAKAAGSIAIGLITHEGSRETLKDKADILIDSITDIHVFQTH